MTKKYRLGEKHPQMDLWRVVAERDSRVYPAGASRPVTFLVGGWVSGEHNLSHDGDAWVFGDARVFGKDARVFGDAEDGSLIKPGCTARCSATPGSLISSQGVRPGGGTPDEARVWSLIEPGCTARCPVKLRLWRGGS